MALLAAICTLHGMTFLLRHEVDVIWFTRICHMNPLGAICTRHGITFLLWHEVGAIRFTRIGRMALEATQQARSK
jgi:hypothetical protein